MQIAIKTVIEAPIGSVWPLLRSRWHRLPGLLRVSTSKVKENDAERLLGLRVRIPKYGVSVRYEVRCTEDGASRSLIEATCSVDFPSGLWGWFTRMKASDLREAVESGLTEELERLEDDIKENERDRAIVADAVATRYEVLLTHERGDETLFVACKTPLPDRNIDIYVFSTATRDARVDYCGGSTGEPI